MNDIVPLLDLRADHWNIIRNLLKKHASGRRVVAFGSRATWTAKEYSDLDLAIFGDEHAPLKTVAALSEGFEESNLPFKVDVVEWSQIDQNLRTAIERDGVVLQAPSSSAKRENRIRNESRTLRELVHLTLSSVDKKSKSNERNVLLCNYMDVYSNRFIESKLKFMPATATDHEIERCTIRVNDVLITKDSAQYDDIGMPALVKENVPKLLCADHLAILRPYQDIVDSTYLYYALQVPDVQRQFQAYANGVTRFSLRADDILRIEVPFHEFREQQTIGQILCTLDEKIALNYRTYETQEAIVRTIFKDWFVDFGPVRAKMKGLARYLPVHLWKLFPDKLDNRGKPVGWSFTNLGEITSLTKGRSYRSSELKASDVALVTLKSFKRGGGYTENGLKPYIGSFKQQQVVSPGDLIVALTDVTQDAQVLGVPAMVPKTNSFNTLVASLDTGILRPLIPNVSSTFLFHLLSTPNYRNHVCARYTGTTVLHLEKDAVSSYPLSVPDSHVLKAFNCLTNPLTHRAISLQKETSVLQQIRDILLPLLVSSELRIPIIEDSSGQAI